MGDRYPRYNSAVFPKLGPATKLLLVPPVYGSRSPCTAQPSVWCTQQTYAQWLELNRGNLSFVSALCVRCNVGLSVCLGADCAVQHKQKQLTVCGYHDDQYARWAFSDPRIVGFGTAVCCALPHALHVWLPTLRVLKGN